MPEPITIGISFTPEFKRSVDRSTRPVEDTAESAPDPQKDTGNRPQPSPRPPGKDPSIPPQALIDAALIAAEFKPDLRIGIPDPAAPAEPEDAPAGTGSAAVEKTATPGSNTSANAAPGALGDSEPVSRTEPSSSPDSLPTLRRPRA